MNLNINYYNILEISKDATFSEIKSKYFQLSKLHHPDKGGDSNKFTLLVDGYNIFKGSYQKHKFSLCDVKFYHVFGYYDLFKKYNINPDPKILKLAQEWTPEKIIYFEKQLKNSQNKNLKNN